MAGPELAEVVQRGVQMRHELHQHPEIAWEEEWTADYIRGELDRLGIPWRPCAGTGTLGRLAADAEGEHLALRADIDGLPVDESTGLSYASQIAGRMHACGHDGHIACLLSTAAWLKAHEQALPGPVTLLFQPAEEGGHGAERMIAEGALEGIERIFGFHSWPEIPRGQAACIDGTIMASNGRFRIEITGRGGHASQPESCRDPIVAGALFVGNLQQVVSRNIAPQDAAVITVTQSQAGQSGNVIPETARLAGTVRALDTQSRDALAKRAEEILHATCTAAEVHGHFEYQPNYPATRNDPTSAERARGILRDLLGEDCLWRGRLPLMASEDFSYYLRERPGAFVLLGSGRDGERLEPCHSPRFDFDDELIPVALRLYARLAGLEGI